MPKCKQCGRAVSIWKTNLFQPTICDECLTFPSHVLYAAYEANELAADEKYKGKTVILTGYIQDIGKTPPVFPFQAACPILVIGSSGTVGSVGCVFHESATSRLARLSKGASVVVEGKVRGKELGVAVMVTDCILK